MKELFFDLLNGFTPDLLPFFGAIVFSAAFFSGITDLLWCRRNQQVFSYEVMLLSTATAVLAYLIKFSLPLAVLSGFLLLAFALRNRSVWGISHFIGIALGVTMGSGFVIPALLAWIVVILPLILLSPRK